MFDNGSVRITKHEFSNQKIFVYEKSGEIERLEVIELIQVLNDNLFPNVNLNYRKLVEESSYSYLKISNLEAHEILDKNGIIFCKKDNYYEKVEDFNDYVNLLYNSKKSKYSISFYKKNEGL
ncbi:hypothetical protein [Enterococcus sp. BWR-S5]|uniref:hypothetical protein n=1 Tax=Enterococcus sp. BWR-S5 TaxID=2787714 RepID=UPI0019242651|nr:hypothetical protein [Enterococcus sp. BWR-S5]MBL1227138.1 hypothetical protein [Enterococcus sp. BWR-S5]